MRIIVFGGRFYGDKKHVFSVLDLVQQEACSIDELILIAGGATGADQLAFDWALDRGVFFLLFPADWDKFRRRAGFVRNTAMAELGKPDLGVMFPGGDGTAMMKKILEETQVPVLEG